VVLGLASSLRAHVRERRLGRIYIAPLDVILTESTIVQPDIIFVSGDRLEAFSSRGLEGAPTLAIEVLSPSTSRTDRGTKRELYARYGLPYYWIVDPEDRWIEVHDLARGADSVVSRFTGSAFASPPPFPGLLIDASSIWDS
jgi:Uma2 family endonuclease